MKPISASVLEAKLAEYAIPYSKQDLVTGHAVQGIDIQNKLIKIQLVFGFPLAGLKNKMIHDVTKLLAEVTPIPIEVEVSWQIASHVGQTGLKGLPQIKNIIAVASGKGGVGKSTTAVNLALALSLEGARVGILDADIYGPSQPVMLGATLPPRDKETKTLKPVISHGIQSMSIGYLIDEKSPMVWRGPMVSMALQQLLNDTVWDNLDYLIIDLPPGTGDIQLTLAQKIPVSGALIVTTPQDLALLDARRAYEMFLKVRVPVLGIIENMSTHVCSQCGHSEKIFGEGGGKRLAQQYGLELLASIPLDMTIREQTDGGSPTVIANPEGHNAKIYCEAARHIAAHLALQPKDYSSKFPNIVVKTD